jgi:hypothetical protein
VIVNSRNANYIINFPKGFWYKNVTDMFARYVKRNPLPYDTVENFMAAQVQSVNFPGLSMQTVSQTRPLGKAQEYKNSLPVADLFNRNISISFKALDGYINYWIALENALEYYQFKQQNEYLEHIQMRFLDQEGHILYTIKFNKPILTGISELSMSYSDNVPEFKTFSMDFSFFDMTLDIPVA